jgi:Tfp pilus assembly protein PilV
MTRARSANQRGVSLVEAIVAMAVMAFGMLGIVGLQATLRQNSDVAKQRSEAVRIAEEAIEQWRAFSIMGATSGASAGYASIQTPANQVIAPDATNKFNTTFTLSRTVADMPGGKTLAVTVSWTDRSNQPQSVTLNTIIAAADPALSGRLTMADTGGGAALPPQGRHPAIPVVAKDLGGGLSGFKPPAPGGQVVWVFSNLTGVIVGVCNTVTTGQAALTAADVSACNNNANGLPLSGHVRFTIAGVQPTAAALELVPPAIYDVARNLECRRSS